MTPVIGYTRVSTREQAEGGLSLDYQTERIQQYCQLHDLDLQAIYTDAGASGYSAKRDGLNEALHTLREGTVSGLVVYKLDRLARKVTLTLNLVEELRQLGIKFYSIQEHLDTDTAAGKAMLGLIAVFAQMERDLISERTTDILQGKIKRGERAGQIPYGYELAEDGTHLKAVPAEQKALRVIKIYRGLGYSYREIAMELESRRIPSRGKAWWPGTIRNIYHRITNGNQYYQNKEEH